MSTLHERLLRWFDAGAPSGDLEDAIAREEAALRAVVELHAPIPCSGFPCFHHDAHNVCKTCGSGTFAIGEPDSTAHCSTITAIAEALGVQIGETP